jgi:chemotaxis protein methyltransferase CheR
MKRAPGGPPTRPAASGRSGARGGPTAARASPGEPASADELPDRLLAGVAAALARSVGISLAAGLEGPLGLAVKAAASELGVAPVALAIAAAAGERDALDVLAEHAVVGETSLWRHAEGLLALSAALAAAGPPLRIWSAGCATGEEPYSLALALLDAGRDHEEDRILGTDVSARALARAREGLYGARATRNLPPALAARWFHPVEAGARVDERLARRVRFERHNLLERPPEDRFDAVVCRNVLIYFDPEVAVAALARLADAVAPGGFLLLGPVELPLAGGLAWEWVERGGATLLRRPG